MTQAVNQNRGEIVIYTNPDGTIQTDVKLFDETLWLSLNQIALLFGRDKSVISRHVKNVFAGDELAKDSTVANFATVQSEGGRNIERNIEYYNLDMILSVGYRVNSKQGTQFRIWANQILKTHLIQGYTINEMRLKEKNNALQTLQSAISLIGRSISQKTETSEEVKELMGVLSDFSNGLALLDDYDHEQLDVYGSTSRDAVIIQPEEFFLIVNQMRLQFCSPLFGTPKDESFISSVRQVYQVFGGKELYPSIEEKAAMLLYLVVKNHSFIDGNKRVAATVFLYFLHRNSALYLLDQKPIIDNGTLAALTLLVAESKPEEKDTIIRVIISLLNRGRQ